MNLKAEDILQKENDIYMEIIFLVVFSQVS